LIELNCSITTRTNANLRTQTQCYIAPACFGVTYAIERDNCLAHEYSTSRIKNCGIYRSR